MTMDESNGEGAGIDSSVRRIMTTDVQTVQLGTLVPDVARLLYETHVSGLPVVEGRRVVGIITEYDLIAQESEWDAPLFIPFLDSYFQLPGSGDRDQLRRILALTAGELMTRPVRTVQPDATIQDVATLMYEHHVNPVPVVDEHGDLLGIVSRSDIIRLMAIEEQLHQST